MCFEFWQRGNIRSARQTSTLLMCQALIIDNLIIGFRVGHKGTLLYLAMRAEHYYFYI